MNFEYAAYSEPGKTRNDNEDNCYIDGKWKDIEREYFFESGIAKKTITAVVCDGMGGFEKGEKASFIAVDTVAKYCKNDREMDFYSIVQNANKIICQEIEICGQAMGATITGIDIRDGEMTVLNLGDSRTYRFRNDKLKQLTKDHSIVQRLVSMGLLTIEEARKHPQKHCITQYLGIMQEDMVVEPQLEQQISIEEGDRYLICSDGLTDMVSDIEIEKILQRKEKVKEAAKTLLNTALANGGIDNVTVVLVEVQQEEDNEG